MANRAQNGQILIELVTALIIITLFISISLAFYQDDQKASYRYLITSSQKKDLP